jgi:hypothetical protein
LKKNPLNKLEVRLVFNFRLFLGPKVSNMEKNRLKLISTPQERLVLKVGGGKILTKKNCPPAIF